MFLPKLSTQVTLETVGMLCKTRWQRQLLPFLWTPPRFRDLQEKSEEPVTVVTLSTHAQKPLLTLNECKSKPKPGFSNLVPRVSLLCLPCRQGRHRRETLGTRFGIFCFRFLISSRALNVRSLLAETAWGSKYEFATAPRTPSRTMTLHSLYVFIHDSNQESSAPSISGSEASDLFGSPKISEFLGIDTLHDSVTWYKITHVGTEVAQCDVQHKATRGRLPRPAFARA